MPKHPKENTFPEEKYNFKKKNNPDEKYAFPSRFWENQEPGRRLRPNEHLDLLSQGLGFPGDSLSSTTRPGLGGRALRWAGGGDPRASQCLNLLGVEVSGGWGGGRRVAETKAEWRRRSLVKLVN